MIAVASVLEFDGSQIESGMTLSLIRKKVLPAGEGAQKARRQERKVLPVGRCPADAGRRGLFIPLLRRGGRWAEWVDHRMTRVGIKIYATTWPYFL